MEVGPGRVFEEEPAWELAEEYRSGDNIEETKRLPDKCCSLALTAVFGILVVLGFLGTIAFYVIGTEIDPERGGEGCPSREELSSNPSVLLHADGFMGFEKQQIRPHPSGDLAYLPGGNGWAG
eukprot:Hpha_TRINITY_DN4821_c0_g2::TRINITY_DN4821_c0_g2_i1::g.20389::m.20389